MIKDEDKICSHFEETAQMIGFELDQSVNCCTAIEEIIQGLADYGDEGALNGARFSAGVYLGKIIKNVVGGNWQHDDSSNQFKLNINSSTIFPHQAIDDYINNKSSILFYVQAIVAKHSA